MSNPRLKIEQIFSAVAELHEVAGDGPRARKLIDSLFRQVHSLKASASANGLNELAVAAHEFENELHSLRKHAVQQSIGEGARLFLVETDFDVADFDRQFRSLKETMNKTGEVISTSPRIDNEKPGKVSFGILYATNAEANQIRLELLNFSPVSVEEVSVAADSPQSTNEFESYASILEHSFQKLSAEVSKLRITSFGDVFQEAVHAGQAAALATGKEVEFEVRSRGLKLDETLTNAIADPLIHLVRNAVDHGIEASDERAKLGKNPRGKIVIEAATCDGQIKIAVTDDGRGIAPTVIDSIFDPGFSTAAELSQISGRGVGLDVVKTQIEEAGGSVSVRSQLGHGSTFEITIPS